MKEPGLRTGCGIAAALAVLAADLPAFALVAPEKNAARLAEKALFRPELHLTSSNVPLQEALTRVANADAWGRFVAEQGGAAQAYLDPRSGTPSSIILQTPIIPGTGFGNHLTVADLGESFGESIQRIDIGVVSRAVRRFVDANVGILGIDETQLGEARGGQAGEDLWQVSFPQEVNGVPVRYGRLLATIDRGNLVLAGTEPLGNAHLDTTPTIAADEADHIGGA